VIFMAHELGVRWGLVNLVCEGQLRRQEPKDAFQDPTTFIRGCLPEESHNSSSTTVGNDSMPITSRRDRI